MLRNVRVTLTISLAGMILPFGVGCAIAVGIYNTFAGGRSAPSFGSSYTLSDSGFQSAFHVLARILRELKVLQMSVEVNVLIAGVGIDVTGWMLLALVALVNFAIIHSSALLA